MKKLCLVLLVILSSLAQKTFATAVGIETARKVGINFFYERISQYQQVKISDITISESFTAYSGSTPVYYTFNTSPAGFIIVSANDACHPVIGYSFEGNLSPENQPSEFKWWMSQMALQVTYAAEHSLVADQETKAMWAFYANATPDMLTPLKSKDVLPLLTCNWDQGKYYNQLCPAASGGPDGKAVVGCVATSMAQIMYYYRFPVNGLSNHGGVNYNATYYRWNEMMDQLSAYNYGVAELCYHAGVAVDMNYGASSSGSQTEYIPDAMQQHFRYNSAITYKNKAMVLNSTWLTTMRSNLNAAHPIVYSGTDPNNGGHAWVCDGYQGTDYFHMNWGWSGNANGYFYITNLVAGGYDFSDWQGMVVNIYPGAGYPSYCSGTLTTVPYTNGTIEDGSGISNYQNNADCQWLIAPTEAVTHIKFTFKRFETQASSDIVTIYDGDNTSAPVLGTFSGSSLPAMVTSSGNKMLVRFTTNGSTTAAGWLGEFRCTFPTFCSGVTTLTAPSGSFDDGSGSFNYSYNQFCRWNIDPPATSSITLSFSEFNVASDDFVKVVDQDANVELATYTGSTIPATQVYNTSNLMVTLKTNGLVNAPGFSCAYTSTPLSVEANTIAATLGIFPNPATAIITISFSNPGNNDVMVDILSMNGENVYSAAESGTGNFSIHTDVSGLAKGVYMLRIRSVKETVTRKIVIL